MFNRLVIEDYLGNISANTITATLKGHSSIVTDPLIGDVIGPVNNTQIITVARGMPIQDIIDNIDSISTLVGRDITSNISANIITANVFNGDLTGINGGIGANSAGTLTGNFTGGGDIVGPASSTIVSSVGGQSATQIALFCTEVDNIIARLDSAGSLPNENIVTATHLVGEFHGQAIQCSSWSSQLAGNVIGTESDTIVTGIGGFNGINSISSGVLANACNSVSNSTSYNTPSTLVSRDTNGSFAMGDVTVTGELVGSFGSETITNAVNFNSQLQGDVAGSQGFTIVTAINGKTTSEIVNEVVSVEMASSLPIGSTLVKSDLTESISVNILTANNLIGPLTGSATSITNFTNAIQGDITGTQNANVVSQLGPTGSKKSATQITSMVNVLNGADSLATPLTLLERDNNGSIWLNQITAQKFTITTNNPTTTVNNFNGFLDGNLTDAQSTTLIESIGTMPTSLILQSVGKMVDMTRVNYVRPPVAIGTSSALKTTILARTPAINGSSSGGGITATQFITGPSSQLAIFTTNNSVNNNNITITNIKGSCTASAGVFRITLGTNTNISASLVFILNPIPSGTVIVSYPIIILSPADTVTANIVANGGGIYAVPVMVGGVFQMFEIMANTLGLNPDFSTNSVLVTSWSYKIQWIG